LFYSNKWVHRQAYQALKFRNQQMPMPPQPTVAETQAKRKALTDIEAQQK
jgi:hypothetical protein